MPISYTEDALVQQIFAEYLEKALGWESVYAYIMARQRNGARYRLQSEAC